MTPRPNLTLIASLSSESAMLARGFRVGSTDCMSEIAMERQKGPHRINRISGLSS